MNVGIYAIRNKRNGHEYVGSSKVLRRRRSHHFAELRRGQHHNQPLQRAWNKYGPDAFEFCVLLICSEGLLLYYEQRCIDLLHPEYNAFLEAKRATGWIHGEKAKRKMRLAWRHREPNDPRPMHTATRGKKQSPEHVHKRVVSRLRTQFGINLEVQHG